MTDTTTYRDGLRQLDDAELYRRCCELVRESRRNRDDREVWARRDAAAQECDRRKRDDIFAEAVYKALVEEGLYARPA